MVATMPPDKESRPNPGAGAANYSINATKPSLAPCPDCAVTLRGQRARHADGCPVARDIERVTRKDRLWFRRHPGRWQRCRPLAYCEVAELRMYGRIPDVEGEVLGTTVVTRISDVLRFREFEDVYLVVSPDALGGVS